jgi:hypothetical protein
MAKANYKAEGKSLVHVDESGFSHESARSHGYAKIGERCYGRFNWGAKGRTNAIGALLNGMLLTISLFKFNVDADVFYAWLTKDLLPKLSEGTVIVMDNASFHKRQNIIQAIEKAGCIAEFLPPYSPDFNSIGRNSNPFVTKLNVPLMSFLALPLLVIFLLCISYMTMITVDGSIFLLHEKFEHFECNLPRSATAKERRKTFIKKAALNFKIQRGFF